MTQYNPWHAVYQRKPELFFLWLECLPQGIPLLKEIQYNMNLCWIFNTPFRSQRKKGWEPSTVNEDQRHWSREGTRQPLSHGKVTAQLNKTEDAALRDAGFSYCLLQDQGKLKDPVGCASSRAHTTGECVPGPLRYGLCRPLPNNDTESRQNALKKTIFSSC